DHAAGFAGLVVAEAHARFNVLKRALQGDGEVDLDPLLVVDLRVAGDVAVVEARLAGGAEIGAAVEVCGARVGAGDPGRGERRRGCGLVYVGVREHEILGEELVLRSACRTGEAGIRSEVEVVALVRQLGVVILGHDLGGAVERVDDQRGGVDRVAAEHSVAHGRVRDVGQPGPVVAGVDVPGEVHV